MFWSCGHQPPKSKVNSKWGSCPEITYKGVQTLTEQRLAESAKMTAQKYFESQFIKPEKQGVKPRENASDLRNNAIESYKQLLIRFPRLVENQLRTLSSVLRINLRYSRDTKEQITGLFHTYTDNDIILEALEIDPYTPRPRRDLSEQILPLAKIAMVNRVQLLAALFTSANLTPNQFKSSVVDGSKYHTEFGDPNITAENILRNISFLQKAGMTKDETNSLIYQLTKYTVILELAGYHQQAFTGLYPVIIQYFSGDPRKLHLEVLIEETKQELKY